MSNIPTDIKDYTKVNNLVILLIFAVLSISISIFLPLDKILQLALSILVIISIIKFPELGFAFFLLIGVLKDFIQTQFLSSIGIDLTIIIFFITLIGLGYKLFVKRQYPLNLKNKYVLLCFCFSFILILSNLYTKSPHYGISKTLSFLVFNNFLLLGGILIASNEKSRNRFLVILQWIIFIYGLVYLYFLIDLFGISFKQLENYYLRFALIGNPISVGRIFSILCVISIIKFYNIKDKNLGKRLIYIFSFILGLIVVIATNSRGPFFALIITLLIYFLFFAKIKVWKSILFLLLFIAVLGMILTILPESFYSRYKLFSGKEIHISEKQISVFSTIDERQQYINQAINYLVENPQAIFIGAGAGSFSHISFNRDQRLYPHNIFIEILLETGIVGFVLFSGVFLFIIFDIFQISRYLDEQDYNNLVMWLLLLILFFLNAQVSGDINDNRMMWFFEGGVIGLILYFIKQKKITVIHNY